MSSVDLNAGCATHLTGAHVHAGRYLIMHNIGPGLISTTALRLKITGHYRYTAAAPHADADAAPLA